MTQKDIRDIAAYWGSPCVYATSPLSTVGFYLLGSLTSNMELGVEAPFKLHLRPIESLTDEQINLIIAIVERNEASFSSRTILRHEQCIQVGDSDLLIHFDGEIMLNGFSSTRTPEIIAYLQFIGIYVPDLIDPKYVELV